MDIQEAPGKKSKEQATQTEETNTEGFPSDYIGSNSIEPEDFLKLNKEGHHKIAIDYIDSLEAKYSKEDISKVNKKVQQLRESFLPHVYKEDCSMDLDENARASIEKDYAEMANDDEDGFVLLSHLEICYKLYSEHTNEVLADKLFPELLSLASRVMKNPQLLKKLYGFKGNA